ncbi:hypothetical protein D3C76_98890 [compost metagenome]
MTVPNTPSMRVGISAVSTAVIYRFTRISNNSIGITARARNGDIALTIIAKRTAEAQANFDELTVLRATNLADYPTEAGGNPAVSHRYALEVCELHHKRYAEMGFPVKSPSPGIQV